MQLKFQALKDYTRSEHGGDLRKGARKLARPVAIKRPMHVVLRSSKARGEWSMLRKPNFLGVQRIVLDYAKRHDVRIRAFANVGNHLHLIVQAKTRKGFQAFLRTVTGLIARLVTGAVKGRASGPFWDRLAYSRLVSWGRDLARLLRYVEQNAAEAFGVATPRKPARSVGTVVIGFT